MLSIWKATHMPFMAAEYKHGVLRNSNWHGKINLLRVNLSQCHPSSFIIFPFYMVTQTKRLQWLHFPKFPLPFLVSTFCSSWCLLVSGWTILSQQLFFLWILITMSFSALNFFPFFLHIQTNVALSLLTMNKFWIATSSKLRKWPLKGTWDVGNHVLD